MKVETRNIIVVPYNPDWPKMFEAESIIIKAVLGDNCLAIHHVGSTSVPGLSAKPKIDILAVVKDPIKAIKVLEEVEFKYTGEYNIPMHYGFSKRGKVDVNLHVYENDHPDIDLMLFFRDYLISHPIEREEYARLKDDLLKEKYSYQKNNYMFTGYNLGKDAFIRKILKQAGFNHLRMMRCTHYAEWDAYHKITEEQVFAPQNIKYNKNHPNLMAENHFHFVLYQGIDIVATAHVEYLNLREAILHFVAIDSNSKSNNLDAEMRNLLEKWIKIQGRNFIKSPTIRT